jgi:hypothetical protein
VKKIPAAGLIGLLAVTIIAIGLVAGCGSNTAPTTTTTSPATVPAASSSAATSSSGQSTSPAQTSPASGSTTLPKYEPSTVVSDTPGSLQLTSQDSIQKVTTFYDNALTQGGWSIISNSRNAYSTNITAKRGSTGTTLAISVTGGGTYISLTTYPM